MRWWRRGGTLRGRRAGRLAVDRRLIRRGDQVLAELGPGDFFGEMGLIDSERRNATVTAKTALRLITLDRWDMKRLEKAIPTAAARIREVVEKRRNA